MASESSLDKIDAAISEALSKNTRNVEYMYGTYVGPGALPGTVNVEILGETVDSLPKYMHIEGQYLRTVTFTSSGTFTKTDHLDMGFTVVELFGPGGGGGGVQSAGTGEGGAGGSGGAGGYSRKKITYDELSNNTSVTLGTPGSGGSAGGGNGGNGGTTDFGGHFTAAGGLGGSGAESNAFRNNHIGGGGGIGSGGDVNFRGGDGFTGQSSGGHPVAGPGGASFVGACRTTSGANISGSGLTASSGQIGAGGSGAFADGSASSASGGTGGPGMAIVHLYTGFRIGCGVSLVRSKLMPLTVVGILSGNTI